MRVEKYTFLICTNKRWKSFLINALIKKDVLHSPGKEGNQMNINIKNSHTNKPEETNKKKSNGEKFKNVCLGIAAIGTMVLPYLHFFLG